MNRIGKVYLVGAGPGDPNLITVKGKQCIERADVILYDRLVSPSLLNRIPAGVEKVFVGKLPDRHVRPQEEINQLLVDYALQGKIVTRLKGGDPFVFGRGGEEAEMLARHGVPFEIVPGITSAIAVPAYAGIPVTHRDYTTSFTVVTGHEHPDKEHSGIQWQQIAESDNTAIFLMGVGQIRHITEQLLHFGRSEQTPVALIRWGTRVEQRTLTGTLGMIADMVEQQRFKGPAIIVIGDVVRLREQLAWFEKKPLFGKRMVVTRARQQASQLSAWIEDMGGEAYECPVIAICPPADEKPMREALQNIRTFQWVVFTSANGVDSFFSMMRRQQVDVRSLAAVKIAAIGEKTAEALQQRGIVPELVPQEYVAEALADALLKVVQPTDRILLPRADLARKTLPTLLRQHGCEVVEVDAYSTKKVTDGMEELLELLQTGAVHLITFTSSSTVRNFVIGLQETLQNTVRDEQCHGELPEFSTEDAAAKRVQELLAHVKIACIGPITADTARSMGLSVQIQAETYTIEGLTEAILHNEGSKGV
ncbi:uroporphyrinogen-III C-methyltransferase [Fodinisporobacter ferrooxydans]|uniref:uroporphyrinogen-III C-methyltransferase n=1 Tax=Fodinisporobacter ferrooxydans TaxID=2901836 RepID=A0ABY4CL40_9BACL|nr:uroporphyrinogen-III C-methyltransferase [Alicyclobacillaceae bacterium MYW30-H2]